MCDVIICYLEPFENSKCFPHFLGIYRSWPVHLYPIFNANKNTNLWAHNKVISLVLFEQFRYTYIIMQDKQIQVNFLLVHKSFVSTTSSGSGISRAFNFSIFKAPLKALRLDDLNLVCDVSDPVRLNLTYFA